MTKTNETHDVSVGYRRPPKEHQFKPGRSGNPNGRPKGVLNFKTELREELGEIIAFREGNHEINISKQRALIKRIVASALEGDSRAIMTFMNFCTRELGNIDDTQPDPEDHQILRAMSRPRSNTSAERSDPTAKGGAHKPNTRGGSHEG